MSFSSHSFKRGDELHTWATGEETSSVVHLAACKLTAGHRGFRVQVCLGNLHMLSGSEWLLGYVACPQCGTQGRGRQRWRALSCGPGSGVCWRLAWRSWRRCRGSAGWAATDCPAAGSDAYLHTHRLVTPVAHLDTLPPNSQRTHRSEVSGLATLYRRWCGNQNQEVAL